MSNATSTPNYFIHNTYTSPDGEEIAVCENQNLGIHLRRDGVVYGTAYVMFRDWKNVWHLVNKICGEGAWPAWDGMERDDTRIAYPRPGYGC